MISNKKKTKTNETRKTIEGVDKFIIFINSKSTTDIMRNFEFNAV